MRNGFLINHKFIGMIGVIHAIIVLKSKGKEGQLMWVLRNCQYCSIYIFLILLVNSFKVFIFIRSCIVLFHQFQIANDSFLNSHHNLDNFNEVVLVSPLYETLHTSKSQFVLVGFTLHISQLSSLFDGFRLSLFNECFKLYILFCQSFVID